MISWEDTVMSNEEIRQQTNAPVVLSGHKRLAQAQAERAFKAGRDSRKDEIEELMSIAFKDGEKIGKQTGIREVVEWIEQNSWEDSSTHQAFNDVNINKLRWQAQLKKWGD